MDVLDQRVKPVLLALCEKKKADEFVFLNPETESPYTDIKRSLPRAGKRECAILSGTI